METTFDEVIATRERLRELGDVVVVQSVHAAPHCVVLLSGAQTLPQRWKPAWQVKSAAGM